MNRDYFERDVPESRPPLWAALLMFLGTYGLCVAVLVLCILWFRATGGGS